MARHRIRAHYEQLSTFERGRIIGLKEAGWTNRRIARHMERIDAAIRRCWQGWVDNGRFQHHDGRNYADWRFIMFSDEFRFQLCPDDHRRRVWRRPGSALILLSQLQATQALNQELWPGVPFLLTAGTLLSSLEATCSTAVPR
ncbi:uncharacterized protein TNCV_917281 [Trichonephila clavipes]|nr:uncharacterized protein TNCV_917281 [Trichonephila clavipes]